MAVKIVKGDSKKLPTFRDLKVGDTFHTVDDTVRGFLWMKMEEIGNANCVALNDGELGSTGEHHSVIPVNITITVEE